MSSSNRVGIYILEETTKYDTLESTGDFLTVRIKSESLDATPNPVKSPEIRPDRLSSGTVVGNTTVGGTLEAMFVRDDANDLLIGMGMYSSIIPKTAMPATTMSINISTKTITFTSGDPGAVFSVDDICQLSGFVDSNNNVAIIVLNTTSTTIVYGGGDSMTDTTGSGAEVATLPDRYEIGTLARSASIEKKYNDLTDVEVDYTGERVESVEFMMTSGEYASINYQMAGASSFPNPDAGSEITNGRTIIAASVNESLISSHDLESILIDGQPIECGFSSLSCKAMNNHSVQTQLNRVNPCDQIAGEGSVIVSFTAELVQGNSDLVKGKIEMNPITIHASMQDDNGKGYAIGLPGVQVTGSDPAASGSNQQTTLEFSGEGTFGPTGKNPMTVYLLD